MDDLAAPAHGPSRRDILKGAAASVILPFAVSFAPRRAEAATPVQIGAFIRIDETNTVTLSIGSTEMGQGIMTGLAQLVAEQLQINWSQMRAEHAIGGSGAGNPYANPLFHAQITGGSTSMMGWYNPMRTAAATVRDMLIQAAAQQTNTAGWKLGTGGTVTNGTTTLTFAAVAATAASDAGLPPPVVATTTKFVGQRMQRLDIPAKVNGSAVFGMDVQVPGMVFASVAHCPTIGGTVGTMPAKPSRPGVLGVINLGNAVAVIATNTWTAIKGASDIERKVSWVLPADTSRMDSATLGATAQSLLTSASGESVFVAELSGTPTLAGATKTLDQTYSLPFLAHACMEVMNCTASVTADKCEIWAPTQGQEFIIPAAAAACGLTNDKVVLHTTYLGGGFGRKIEADYVLQAVECSKQLGVPVKLIWSREQDFQNDRFRPSALIRVQAGLDASNNITSVTYRNVSPSIKLQRGPSSVSNPEDTGAVAGAKGLPYSIGARQIEHVALPTDIPLGYWRSVGESYNTFAVESAMDELAKLAAINPLNFRRDRLTDPRAKGVLSAVETLSSWKNAPPSGYQRGVAFLKGFGSYIAMVAEVGKASTGTIKVSKIYVAVDCGVVVNPDQVEAQMQGGIAHGLAAAMWHQATFVAGVPKVRNFNNYPYLKLQTMPTVSIKLVTSTAAPGGVGETAVPVVAPAVANAWAKLTNTRLRSLPFYPGTTMGGL